MNITWESPLHCRSETEVAGGSHFFQTRQHSCSKFFESGSQSGSRIFQIWESGSCSGSSYHRSNRNSPIFLLYCGTCDSGSVFHKFLTQARVPGTKEKRRILSGSTPDPSPPLVRNEHCTDPGYTEIWIGPGVKWNFSHHASDVVQTKTWLKLKDRDFSNKSRKRDLEVRDRDSRLHISLMVIKANSLKNAAKKFWNVAKYQDKGFAIAMLQQNLFWLRKICWRSCSLKALLTRHGTITAQI